MAIKDLDQAAQVVKLYADLKQAALYAKQWADSVVGIQAQINALPDYGINADAAQKQYVATLSTISDTFSKAVPIAPDVVALPDIKP